METGCETCGKVYWQAVIGDGRRVCSKECYIRLICREEIERYLKKTKVYAENSTPKDN